VDDERASVGVATQPPAAAPPARRSDRRRIVGIAGAALVLAFLGYALARGWGRVSDYEWQFEWGWLAGGVLLMLAGYAATGLAYLFMVERLSHAHPSRAIGLSIWARSLLGRYVPGNVMMLVGRAVMAEEHGVPRKVTVAATVYEQALSLGIGAAGAVAFLAVYGDRGEGRYLWLLVLVPFALVGLHPRPFGRMSGWALTRLRRRPLETLLSGRQVAGFLAVYALVTLPVCLGAWALIRSAAGSGVGGPGFVGLAFLFSYAVGMLALVFPSGLGIRDGAFAVALSQNVPGSVAVALSVGLRFALILIELLFVTIAVAAGRRGRE
jgi:hypothetical protein